MDNAADVLRQLQAEGLLVDHLEVTGRIVRTRVEGDRERRGWYVLHEIPTRDGRRLVVGAFGVNRGTDHGTRKIEVGKDDLTDDQRAAYTAQLREARRQADRARARDAARAARRAELVWRKAAHTPPAGVVPEYLQRKGVGGHGVRYTETGAVVVAMHDAQGQVHGLQFLLSRAGHAARIQRTGRDKEYWPRGLAKRGHFFLIGAVTGLVLLTEGYATAASLHEATGAPVAVAFDAGNLASVAQALHKRYPRARILVCADDDFATAGNPGITSASAAALAVGGAWVAPAFTDAAQVELRAQIAARVDWTAPDHRDQVAAVLAESGVGKATDYNDLHALEGLLTVRAQVEAKLATLGWGAGGSSGVGTTTGGEGRAEPEWHFDLDRLIQHYTLIYGTDTVFDAERRLVLGLGPLRSAAGKGLVRTWLEHPDRHTVLPEQVGFDPTERDPAVKCNLWGGWPTTPRAGSCERLLELLEYLCNGVPAQQQELYHWVLRWLAYPIQHPGAKMQTAVLMHGPEGTGKNTFFGVLRAIYGRYGTQFSQVELESNFNGWASGKLFAIGNEVVSRSELYHIQGRLKAMVTEPEWIINEKMLPARSEQNHCNFVFFSNRVDIAKLDDKDRRYCVVWTPEALFADFYRQVAEEISAGGVAALHHYLLHLDLGDFSPHTKPPMTDAKRDLVDLGMDSTDRFFRDWCSGLIGLPALAAASDDLYGAYRTWCQREGIGKSAQKQTLLTVLGKKPGIQKRQERLRNGLKESKRVVLITEEGARQIGADGRSRQDWLGMQVEDFASAAEAYRQDL